MIKYLVVMSLGKRQQKMFSVVSKLDEILTVACKQTDLTWNFFNCAMPVFKHCSTAA